MLRFVLRRLVQLVPVLVGLSLLLFIWVRALPGDPARALLGEKATPEGLARVTEAYGFDEPVLQQYVTYVTALLHGDFGNSIQTGQPVTEASSRGSRPPSSWAARPCCSRWWSGCRSGTSPPGTRGVRWTPSSCRGPCSAW